MITLRAATRTGSRFDPGTGSVSGSGRRLPEELELPRSGSTACPDNEFTGVDRSGIGEAFEGELPCFRGSSPVILPVDCRG